MNQIRPILSDPGGSSLAEKQPMSFARCENDWLQECTLNGDLNRLPDSYLLFANTPDRRFEHHWECYIAEDFEDR
jgi:hypothetical protein